MVKRWSRLFQMDFPQKGLQELLWTAQEIREANTNFDLRHKKMQDGRVWGTGYAINKDHRANLIWKILKGSRTLKITFQPSTVREYEHRWVIVCRTSSRARSRKSTRRTASCWTWQAQTHLSRFKGSTEKRMVDQEFQFCPGVAKPSGWIRGRQVQGLEHLGWIWLQMQIRWAKCIKMLHTLCLLVPLLYLGVALCFTLLCQLLKAHEEQLLQLRSAQVRLQLQSYHVTMLRELWKNCGHGVQWGSFREPVV